MEQTNVTYIASASLPFEHDERIELRVTAVTQSEAGVPQPLHGMKEVFVGLISPEYAAVIISTLADATPLIPKIGVQNNAILAERLRRLGLNVVETN